MDALVHLARKQSGEGVARCIEQAIDHPSIFCFGELLALPSVQAVRASDMSAAPPRRRTARARPRAQLADTKFAPTLALLKLFTSGTCADVLGAWRRPRRRRPAATPARPRTRRPQPTAPRTPA
jgi:hypothetical protein